MPLLADALRAGPLVLDGGLATALEAAGHDLSGGLWSARLLQEEPEALLEVHRAYAASGARVLETASYQATLPGFAAAGVGPAEAARLVRLSVSLARQAADEATARDGLPRWVAGSVGPYGAMLADGSEYTGAYVSGVGVGALAEFHRGRIEALVSAGVDVLACETLPAVAEVQALVSEVEAAGVPAWYSLTTVTDASGVSRTRRGEPAAEAFVVAAASSLTLAVGANCTAPSDVTPALRAAAAVTPLPLVAYPNSGETWDAPTQHWTGTPDLSPADVTTWRTTGAKLIGGCCRVGPSTIATL